MILPISNVQIEQGLNWKDRERESDCPLFYVLRFKSTNMHVLYPSLKFFSLIFTGSYFGLCMCCVLYSRVCFAWIPPEELPPGALLSMNTSKTLSLSYEFLASRKRCLYYCVYHLWVLTQKWVLSLVFSSMLGLSNI